MFRLNIAADDALLIKSGMLFNKGYLEILWSQCQTKCFLQQEFEADVYSWGHIWRLSL